MSDREWVSGDDITSSNWEKYQEILDDCYEELPKEVRELVSQIIELEIALERLG